MRTRLTNSMLPGCRNRIVRPAALMPIAILLLCAIPAKAVDQPAPVPGSLTINGSVSGRFEVGQSWHLSLVAGPANSPFALCGAHDDGQAACVSDFATTDANGAWTLSGLFDNSTSGLWTEWVVFGSGAISNPISFTVGDAPRGAVLWSAGSETEGLSQWYFPAAVGNANGGGGEFKSGTAGTAISAEQAHSGKWSLKLTITTPPESGTRMFRWLEAHQNRSLYYSVWVYMPTQISVTGSYLNLVQFKSATSDGSRKDPIWAFYLNNGPGGQLYLSAGWGAGGTALAGPYSTDGVGLKSYPQWTVPFPAGRWVHLRAFLKESNAFDGQLTFWQDGVKLWDFQNVRTSYNNCSYNSWCADNGWSVNLYSDGVSPSPASIYVDDAAISAP